MKIYTKMDSRYKGFPEFKYCIDGKSKFKGIGGKDTSRKELFYLWRIWCWDTWGPSKELNDWLEDQRDLLHIHIASNHSWCWVNDDFATRIYLRTDSELTLFLLKWAQ